MPRRDDLHTILVIGSGPIVIGQACEFDYSGTQAVRALREDGYRVVLINSNPATIMTDPELADATYLEPMTPETLEMLIAAERPDALLPTLGGQTALNLAVAVAEAGILARHGVELIGADLDAITVAEDRSRFRTAMERIGLRVPRSGYARSLEEARTLVPAVGLPAVVRPSFTLGGAGAGIAWDAADFDRAVAWGLDQSPRGEVLIEQNVLGWKEYELEVMRDGADNVVIICSIENFDPMGVHTGDSITVAPAQTLTDREYQEMRSSALAIIREIGVDTGGSNIQFAVHPQTGEQVVIEMNPRVSRSSALASKATGFPIAKIAAKLAVGYRLDELSNDITRVTPASFEPVLDYIATKIPRFAFEKFPGSDPTLGMQMQSVGEVMGLGRSFAESLQKAIRSLEIDRHGLEAPRDAAGEALDDAALWRQIEIPSPQRLFALAEGLRRGFAVDAVSHRSGIDPWFTHQIQRLIDAEAELVAADPAQRRALLRPAKELGFSDRRLAALWGCEEEAVRAERWEDGIRPVYKRVDTCAAEFASTTPYLYSSYEQECEAEPDDRPKIAILGGGPNRIGQGIEFDYCCVHAAMALREAGYETIMINCNPETVSTDYDISDRLYFEPLTAEDVLEVLHRERPDGVIVQYGGQTPLRLAQALEKRGVPILGTPPDAIDRAENRERFDTVLDRLGLARPPGRTAHSAAEAERCAAELGYPVLLRPSYVLGGRAMVIVNDACALRDTVREAVRAAPGRPLWVDRFLADAIEVDVDAICDGERVVLGGVMEHIEEAGVHSGDSACSLPPRSLAPSVVVELGAATRALALELGVRGLVNVQYAVKDGAVYVLEVNPRASRTIPFVSKAIGVPLAQLGALVMAGRRLSELGFDREVEIPHVAVKESVFPFLKFAGVDTLLGPEMKSTGEVMGIDSDFGRAYAKAQIEAGAHLPRGGALLVSARDADKAGLAPCIGELATAGFHVLATHGTARFLRDYGVATEVVPKVGEGHPDTVERIERGDIDLVINTVTSEPQAVRDSRSMRRAALVKGLPYFTTAAGARAAAGAIRAQLHASIGVRSLQAIHSRRADR